MRDTVRGGDSGFRERSAAGRTVSVAAIVPRARFIGCDDIATTGITDVASRCGPGDVFVARLTERGDGHDAVARAVSRGVSGVIAERVVPTSGVPLCVVPDSTWTHARLSHALAGDPARRLRVIAVTGTSGKTTTAWLAAAALMDEVGTVGMLSDVGCLGPEGSEPMATDLAQPACLAAALARLADSGCTHVVLEVSSRQLAGHALAGVACDTVVVTNVARAHLDLHGTARAYRRIKSRILDALAPDGCLVADGDGRLDRLLRRAAARSCEGAAATTSLTAGFRSRCDVRGRIVERGRDGQTFMLTTGGRTVPVTLASPLRSFTRDALLAAAVGLRYGLEPRALAHALEAADVVPGRMERLDRGQDVPVFVDAASSGHALASTLGGLRRLTPGRLVLLAAESTALAVAGRGGLERRVSRWCDECLVAPPSMVDEDCDATALAAYARIDRLMSSLGSRDCVLVLDGPGGSRGPDHRGVPLAALIDGWLRLAHDPGLADAWRHAA